MHIPDGMISLGACAIGYVASGALTSYSLNKIRKSHNPSKDITRIALGTAVFFTATLISIPVPPASVHPILAGLCGISLGIYAPAAILVSLFFQAILFSHGGLSTLGVNALILSLPALLGWKVHETLYRYVKRNPVSTWCLGFLNGIISSGLAISFFAIVITLFMPSYIDAEAEKYSLIILITAHIPLLLVESAITGFAANYIERFTFYKQSEYGKSDTLC